MSQLSRKILTLIPDERFYIHNIMIQKIDLTHSSFSGVLISEDSFVRYIKNHFSKETFLPESEKTHDGFIFAEDFSVSISENVLMWAKVTIKNSIMHVAHLSIEIL